MKRLKKLDWIRVLSLVGLAIATYLSVNYARDTDLYCAGSGGCESVQNSEYVTIIGPLEVPMLGMFGCILLLALTLLQGRLGETFDAYLPLLLYGTASIGFFYSLYLTYLEAFVIHQWCYWCLGSATVMTLIWALSILHLRETYSGHHARSSA